MQPAKHKSPVKKPSSSQQHPVRVYCRVRPLSAEDEECCVDVNSRSTIQLHAPDGRRVTQHTFKKVFGIKTTQKELFEYVAKPLVDDLIRGKNGLLLTCGVSGSGKAYTMTGSPGQGGMLPRTLGMIFNSIRHFQAKRYVFKPDENNGMEWNLLLEHQRRVSQKSVKKTVSGRQGANPEFADMVSQEDMNKSDEVDEDSCYSVFVSCLEFYNNYIYDLLEEAHVDPVKPKPPQSKVLQEDLNRNMYVAGCTEVEVKSPEQAFEVFWRDMSRVICTTGQMKRRISNTRLNRDSSSSHSVFIIKLAQAPRVAEGDIALQTMNQVKVSQLCLVDLDGSEHTSKTLYLRQPGNFSTLQTLNTCIKVLRENQIYSTKKMVPYRDSKMTHLFRNYFDGNSKIRMVVCINPKAEDYEESLWVMRFAEMTQEIEVVWPVDQPICGFASDRRQRDQLPSHRLEERGCPVDKEPSAGLSQMLQGLPSMPRCKISDPADDHTLPRVIKVLKERHRVRQMVTEEYNKAGNILKSLLQELDGYMISKDNLIHKLQVRVEERDKIIQNQKNEMEHMGKKTKTLKCKIDILQKTTSLYEEDRHALQHELENKEQRLQQEISEKKLMKVHMQGIITDEKLKWQKECERRVHAKELEMQGKLWLKEEKLQQVKAIVTEGITDRQTDKLHLKSDSPVPIPYTALQLPVSPRPFTHSALYSPERPTHLLDTVSSVSVASCISEWEKRVLQANRQASPPLRANRRRAQGFSVRRDRFCAEDCERTLQHADVILDKNDDRGAHGSADHKSLMNVVLDTVMQPSIPNTTEVSDSNKKALSLLSHQDVAPDGKGETETQPIKDEVSKIRGGEQAVQSTDTETLPQEKPLASW